MEAAKIVRPVSTEAQIVMVEQNPGTFLLDCNRGLKGGSHLQVKSWTWETLTSFEVLMNAAMAALGVCQLINLLINKLAHIHDTHTHG